jgi:hypothetical protein
MASVPEISLTQPIAHDGKKVTSLKSRRPIVIDMPSS